MKKFLKAGLSIALGAVIILGGFVAYKIGELKNTLEFAMNKSNEQLGELGLNFDPFKCSGLFSIECKAKEVRYENDVILENIVVRWKSFRLSSIVSEFETDLKIPEISEFNRDEREFLKIVGPRKIKLWGKTTKLNEEAINAKINLNVQAQNLDYSFKSDFDIHAPSFVKEIPISFLDSQKFSDWIKNSDSNKELERLILENIEKFKLVVYDGMEVAIKAKDFQPALFSFLRNNEYRFENLNDDEIRAQIVVDSKFAGRHIGDSSLANAAFEAVLGFILGEKEKVVARLNKTISLTNETDFSSLLKEFERSVSIQAD